MKANHKRKLNSKMLLFLNKLTTASKFNNKKRKEVGRSLNNEQRIQCVLRKIDSLLYLNTFLFFIQPFSHPCEIGGRKVIHKSNRIFQRIIALLYTVSHRIEYQIKYIILKFP